MANDQPSPAEALVPATRESNGATQQHNSRTTTVNSASPVARTAAKNPRRIGKLEQTIVTLKIGEEGKPFNVHKELLCSYSRYFQAAFQGSFREAQEGVITLPEVSVETFQVVMEWLYTQKLPNVICHTSHPKASSQDPRPLSPPKPKSKELSKCTICCTDVYIFGDCYNLPALRNAVLDQIYDRYQNSRPNEWPSYASVIRAFSNLPESSKLCQMFLDIYSDRYRGLNDSERKVEQRSELPDSFVRQLFVRLSDRPTTHQCDEGKLQWGVYFRPDFPHNYHDECDEECVELGEPPA